MAHASSSRSPARPPGGTGLARGAIGLRAEEPAGPAGEPVTEGA